MKDEKFENVEVSLNYHTFDTDKEDVICIETHGRYGENDCMAITVDEAKWLSGKLLEFVEGFEKQPKFKAKRLINLTENTLNGEITCWQDDRLNEFIKITKELIK